MPFANAEQLVRHNSSDDCLQVVKLVRGGSMACDGVATGVILCNAHHHVAESLHDQTLSTSHDALS